MAVTGIDAEALIDDPVPPAAEPDGYGSAVTATPVGVDSASIAQATIVPDS